MRVINYKGYRVVQTSNGNIRIYKDKRHLSFVACSEQKTDKELKTMVDAYIEAKKSEG